MRTRRLALAAACAAALAAPALALPPAVYEVEFEATWSAATHPTDFPPDPHFSPPVGATHDDTVVLWETGGIATRGIERMAERGRTAPLESEVEPLLEAGNAGSFIVGSGFDSPGTTLVQFEISEAHPYVTLVSMVAPSPDWFVGVNGLPLLENGAWLDEAVVDLGPYDAGSDDGATFLSLDADTVPKEPIQALTGFPFEDTPPLGQFRFRRLPGCSDGIDNDGDGLIDFDGGGVGAADPQCLGNPDRDLERARACGLGFEASLVVAGVALGRRMRSRRS
ncbi:MAG: spondin domain-containing protein [Myxococcota bacterium]|nr:spondin domain-containing protein [Myxococcota bacterium]